MEVIIFIENAIAHFLIRNGALTIKVVEGMTYIREGKKLEGLYKKLFALILFSYAMHKGPITFVDVEQAAETIGVEYEVRQYAKSWTERAKEMKAKLS